MQWSDGHVLVFNDARRFGLMLMLKEKTVATHPLLKELGPRAAR